MAKPAPYTKPLPASPAQKQLNPLLASYLASLAARPLLTKCCTSGTLSFFQEIIASRLAGVPPKVKKTGVPPVDLVQRAGVDVKVLKLAFYGFFISAPLGHTLLRILQRAFEGRTDARAKLEQIVASNVFVAPIQNTAFLAAMAVINGAKSTSEVLSFWKKGFLPIMRLSWIVGPLSMAFAQKYLEPEMWVVFFNMITFVLGTFLNVRAKKVMLEAMRKKRAQEEREKKRKGQ